MDPNTTQFAVHQKFTAMVNRYEVRPLGPDGAEGAVIAVGQVRSLFGSVRRRLSDVPFLRFHFDFVGADGQTVLVSERQASLRDRSVVSTPRLGNGWQLDWRVAAAMAVALDALQAR